MKRAFTVLSVSVLLAAVVFENAESKQMQLDEVRYAVRNLRKVCMDKAGVSKSLLDAADQNPISEFPSDRALQCYFRCILINVKGMKNGTLRPQVMHQVAQLMLVDDVAVKVSEVIDICSARVTSTESCEMAWQFTKCMYEVNRDLIFF